MIDITNAIQYIDTDTLRNAMCKRASYPDLLNIVEILKMNGVPSKTVRSTVGGFQYGVYSTDKGYAVTLDNILNNFK